MKARLSRSDSTGRLVVRNNRNNVGTGKEGTCREDFKLEGSAEEEAIDVSDAMAQLKFEGEAGKRLAKQLSKLGVIEF